MLKQHLGRRACARALTFATGAFVPIARQAIWPGSALPFEPFDKCPDSLIIVVLASSANPDQRRELLGDDRRVLTEIEKVTGNEHARVEQIPPNVLRVIAVVEGKGRYQSAGLVAEVDIVATLVLPTSAARLLPREPRIPVVSVKVHRRFRDPHSVDQV